MTDTHAMADGLILYNRFNEPVIRAAMDWLAFPAGAVGLDAGCGVGTYTGWLAERVGPDGQVVGLDRAAALLAVARERTEAPNVRFDEGDLFALPYDDDTFDFVWCADVLWPPVNTSDPVGAVRGLARVVRPGGTIALAYWSGQHILPGYPALEAHLNDAYARHYHGAPESASAPHNLRAPAWFAEAGLTAPRARTFARDALAPLSALERQAVAAMPAMLWGAVGLDEDTEARLRAATAVFDDPGYFGVVTYTVFAATVC